MADAALELNPLGSIYFGNLSFVAVQQPIESDVRNVLL